MSPPAKRDLTRTDDGTSAVHRYAEGTGLSGAGRVVGPGGPFSPVSREATNDIAYSSPQIVSAAGQARAVAQSRAFRLGVLPLALALSIGMFIRLSFILGAGFPLNDGGMFYAMAQDVQRAHYLLPAYTSYNQENIPFAYPPLGFYLAALADDLTPFDMLQVFRFLPFALNVATIGAVFLLARAMLGPGRAAGIAAVAYAVVPRSFTWLIVGGGVTRSLGFLLAVIATYGMYRYLARGGRRLLALGTVAGGLSMLSHPDVGVLTAVTFLLLFLCWGRSRRGVVGLAAASAGIGLIVAPWLLTVLARHGWDPLQSAMGTGEHETVGSVLRRLVLFQFTEERYGPLIGFLGMFGVFVAVARGLLFLPAWLLVMFLVVPRSAASYAAVPMALLIGLLFAHALLPGISRAFVLAVQPSNHLQPPPGRITRLWSRLSMRTWAPRAAAALLVAYTLVFGAMNGLHANEHVLTAVAPADRDTMRWIDENMPEGTTWAVVSYAPWAIDRAGEWFPVIARRESVATVQGTEWLGAEHFHQMVINHDYLAACAAHDLGCVDGWKAYTGAQFDYLYLTSGCCSPQLVESLMRSPDYVMVRMVNGASIWRAGASARSGLPN